MSPRRLNPPRQGDGGGVTSLFSTVVLQQVGWFILQTKPLERLGLWNAVLIKALVFIQFIHHLLEFFPVDHSADDIGCSPPAGLVKIAVIEHVSLFEIFSLQAFAEVKQS